MNLYRQLVRPVAFQLDAEWTHHTVLGAAGGLCRVPGVASLVGAAFGTGGGAAQARLRTRVAGLDFRSPLVLPAGMDKNGVACELFAAIGFGGVEVGSVSVRPSAGNRVHPRLFRVVADEGLMVHYGVPNDGAEVIARRLAGRRPGVPLGISLVETNTGVPAGAEAVLAEIAGAARILAPCADYFAINLHCPNSPPGANPLDDPQVIAELLARLAEVTPRRPVFLKVRHPRDLSAIDALVRAVSASPVLAGYIVGAALPKPYEGYRTPAAQLAAMPGTLTAPPIHAHALAALAGWDARIDRSRHVLVGTGGILSGEHAYAMIRAGASLVQLLTGLVFQGPGLVRRVNEGLARLLERDGLPDVAAAVGLDRGKTA